MIGETLVSLEYPHSLLMPEIRSSVVETMDDQLKTGCGMILDALKKTIKKHIWVGIQLPLEVFKV